MASVSLWVVAGLLMITLPREASADEPLFGFVNTTDLLPQGKTQIEHSVTVREGSSAGAYHLWEGRTEVDYGLANSLQVTGYLNASYLDADVSPVEPVTRGRIDGVTGEAIWRLTSPYLSPVGLALLADGTVGRGQPSGGLKAIAQKNFRDDTIVLAANLRVDLGLRERATLPDGERVGRAITPIELGLGASYRFRPNWSLAIELRGRNKYSGRFLGGGRLEETALFLGPTVHYGGERWFLTFSALRRIQADHRRPAGVQTPDSLVVAAERTRWDGVRLRVGRTF